MGNKQRLLSVFVHNGRYNMKEDRNKECKQTFSKLKKWSKGEKHRKKNIRNMIFLWKK